MKKIGVYILICSNGKYYTGSTDDLQRRMEEHQRGKSKATMNLLPVRLVAFIEFLSLSDARKMEYRIKKMKSRNYIEMLISRQPV